jgi:hypothetical protein
MFTIQNPKIYRKVQTTVKRMKFMASLEIGIKNFTWNVICDVQPASRHSKDKEIVDLETKKFHCQTTGIPAKLPLSVMHVTSCISL